MRKSNLELPSNIKFSEEEVQFISNFSNRRLNTSKWSNFFDDRYTFSDFQKQIYSFPNAVYVMKACMRLIKNHKTRGSFNNALLSIKEHWTHTKPYTRICYSEVTKVFTSPAIIQDYLNSTTFTHAPFLESAWKQLTANPAIDTGFSLVFQEDTNFRKAQLIKKIEKHKPELIKEEPQKAEPTQDIAICLQEYYVKFFTQKEQYLTFNKIFNEDNLSISYFKQSICKAPNPGDKLMECLRVFNRCIRARLFHAFLSPNSADNIDLRCQNRPCDPESLKVINSIERKTLLAHFTEKNKKRIEAHINSKLVLDEDQKIVKATKLIQEDINNLTTEIHNLNTQIKLNTIEKENPEEESLDKQYPVINKKRKNDYDSQPDVKRRRIENSKPIDLETVEFVRKHYVTNPKTNKKILSGCDKNFWKQLKTKIFSSDNPYATFKACLDVVRIQCEKHRFLHGFLKPYDLCAFKELNKYKIAPLDTQARDLLIGHEEDIVRCLIEKYPYREYKSYFKQHMVSTNIKVKDSIQPNKKFTDFSESDSEISMESIEPQNFNHEETSQNSNFSETIDSAIQLEYDLTNLLDEFPWTSTEETTTNKMQPQDNSILEIHLDDENNIETDVRFVNPRHSHQSEEMSDCSKPQYHYGQNKFVVFAPKLKPSKEHLNKEEKNYVVLK